MFVSRKKYQAALDDNQKLRLACLEIEHAAVRTRGILRQLRANCFITNEKGHRVRYINASPERQAKAEGR